MAEQLTPTKWIWRDGAFVDWQDATVHIMSHVVHYGSSVFEGIRFYRTDDGAAIVELNEHLRRFEDSARIYRMPLGYTVRELADSCKELIRRNGLSEGYIRPVAFRGYGAIGLDPSSSPVETYIVCWPWGAYLGDGALEAGVDVCVSTWNRPAPNTFPVMAKAGGGYVNAQLMKMEALANGYAEAIALGPDGLVSEGSGQNLFVVRDGVLHTPSLDGTLLPGITRRCILTLARELDIHVREQRIPREMLYVADELFFTGTAAEITPIRSVDRIPVGDGRVGPITGTLQRRYLDIVRGRRPDRHGWLTRVPAEAGVRAS